MNGNMNEMGNEEGREGNMHGRMHGKGCHKGMMGMHHMHHIGGFIGIKYMILKMAREGEINGAQIIETISDVTEGRRRPSPGNIYPALKDLYEEGYLSMKEEKGIKYYSITDKGSELIKEISNPFMGMFKRHTELETSEYLKKYNISSQLDNISNEVSYLLENSEQFKSDEELSKKVDQIIKDLSTLKN